MDRTFFPVKKNAGMGLKAEDVLLHVLSVVEFQHSVIVEIDQPQGIERRKVFRFFPRLFRYSEDVENSHCDVEVCAATR